MTSVTTRFEPAARRELLAAMEYEHREDGLGERFLDAAREAIERAGSRPLLFPELRDHPDVRRVMFRRFPYIHGSLHDAQRCLACNRSCALAACSRLLAFEDFASLTSMPSGA